MNDGGTPRPSPAKAATGVAYVRAGDGAPLVLCHGGAGSWTHWIRSLDALAAHFTVFALDLPGYGASEAPPRDIPPDDYLAIVQATIEELCAGASRIGISGFSFGALVATAMAAGLGPRASALSLIGASGFEAPVGRPVRLMSERRLREALDREPTAEELRWMHADNLAELMIWDRSKIDAAAVTLQIENVGNTRFDSRRLSWSGRITEFMAHVLCPTTMIYGEHDRSAHPSIQARLARCLAIKPDIEVEIVEACGHWAMYEAPDRLNAALLAFHGRTP